MSGCGRVSAGHLGLRKRRGCREPGHCRVLRCTRNRAVSGPAVSSLYDLFLVGQRRDRCGVVAVTPGGVVVTVPVTLRTILAGHLVGDLGGMLHRK